MLFGHENKVGAFKNLFAQGKLGQSYLFFGDSQIGKKNFAELLGYFLETGKFEKSVAPAIDMQIFKSGENGSIGVETSVEIRKFLWATPFRSSRRLAIIDDAQNLTPEAQSALLKIVEEPPRSSLLIFIAIDKEALFPPLLSRLTKIYFSRLPRVKVKEILIKHYEITEARAERLSREAFGRLGFVLDLLRGKPPAKTDDLANEIESEILKLRGEDLRKNSKKLSILLNRETLVKRYNLNINLQRKAISYELNYG